MIEQIALIATYTLRLWVVVPANSRGTVAVGPCSYEVALDHVERWNATLLARRAVAGTSYHLRAATPAEVADTRAWETELRYRRDQWLVAA